MLEADEKYSHLVFISSSRGENVSGESLSQLLWAWTEKTLSCSWLGMLKGGGISDIEIQPHALKYLNCLRREQAMEKVTEDSCHGSLLLPWSCGLAALCSGWHLQGCWPDPPRGTASPELLLQHL